MKLRYIVGSLSLLGACLATPSRAADYSWIFATANSAQGASKLYKDTTNTYSITAYGWVKAIADPVTNTFTTGTNLYEKFDGAGETGLGVQDDDDHEINTTHFVQLDLRAAKAAGLSNLRFSIGSLQSGEGYYVYGSNTLGKMSDSGSALKSGIGTPVSQLVSFATLDYDYYTVIAQDSVDNILIENGLKLQAVPEPAFYQLSALLGLGGLGLFRIRRRA